MASVTFDALKFVETLGNAGVERAHASAVAVAVREAHESALADHDKVQQEFSAHAVSELDTKTEKSMFAVQKAILGLSAKFDLLEQRTYSCFTLLQWMLGVLIAGVLALVMRAFFFPALPPVV